MSKFTGKQGQGAERRHREQKRVEAEVRQEEYAAAQSAQWKRNDCFCGTDATSLNPAEVVTHSPDGCYIRPVA